VFLTTTEYLPSIEVPIMTSGNPMEIGKRKPASSPLSKRRSQTLRGHVARRTRRFVIMHQDAFAADYQDEEYRLMGMAIKFAGICGKEVRIIGTNRQTVDQNSATQ
jgi:hypothetical protein